MSYQLALAPFVCVVSWCKEDSNQIDSICEFCEYDAVRGW